MLAAGLPGWAPAVPPQAAPPRLQTPAPATHYSLEDCLRQAATANPDLAQAQASLEQARASVEQVYVALNPTVSTTFSYYRTLQPVQPSPSGFSQFLNSLVPGLIPSTTPDPDTYSGGVVLQQTISTFGRLRWTALAQKLNEKSVGQNYRSALLTVLQQAEKAYVTVKISEAQLDLVQRRRQLYQQFLDIARYRFKAGMIAEFDVIQSETQVQSADLQVQQTLLQRDTARVALFILMGVAPLDSVIFDPLPEIENPPPNLEDPLAYALEHRPEVAALRWSLASAQANVEAAWHNNAPNLSLVSQYMMTQVPGTVPQPSWIAGLQLSAPIYDGGQAKVMAQLAQATLDQVRGNLGSQTRQVDSDVRTQYLTLRNLWAQLDEATANCKLNDEAVSISLNRYKAGISNSTEWLTAQSNWTDAQQNRINLQSNYRQALADWRRAVAAPPRVELPPSAVVDWSEPPRTLAPGEYPDESWLEKKR
jgi:outer membrane protein TolC